MNTIVRLYVVVIPRQELNVESARLRTLLEISGKESEIEIVLDGASSVSLGRLDSSNACIIMAAKEVPKQSKHLALLFRKLALSEKWVYLVGESGLVASVCPYAISTTLSRFFDRFLPMIIKAARFKKKGCGI